MRNTTEVVPAENPAGAGKVIGICRYEGKKGSDEGDAPVWRPGSRIALFLPGAPQWPQNLWNLPAFVPV